MSYDENRVSDLIDGGEVYKKYLHENLIVGAKIKIGEKYAEKIGGFDGGEIIELIEGYFDYENGLYTETQTAPAIWDELENDYESIFHLFGNNLEDFMDCEIIHYLSKQ